MIPSWQSMARAMKMQKTAKEDVCPSLEEACAFRQEAEPCPSTEEACPLNQGLDSDNDWMSYGTDSFPLASPSTETCPSKEEPDESFEGMSHSEKRPSHDRLDQMLGPDGEFRKALQKLEEALTVTR